MLAGLSIAAKQDASVRCYRIYRPIDKAFRKLPEALYGYAAQRATLTGALARGCTVSLSGPGGTGKARMGAAAVERRTTSTRMLAALNHLKQNSAAW